MSLVLVEANALCLHIPFCGGTWVRSALAALGLETRDPVLPCGLGSEHGLRHQFEERYDFAFAFIRHPLSWYRSWYVRSYRNAPASRQGPQRRFLPHDTLAECRHAAFGQALRKCLKLEPGFVSRMYEWYLGPPGAPTVDMIGRQENLLADLTLILRALNYKCDVHALTNVPRQNERDLSIQADYPDDLRSQMFRAEHPAILRWRSAGALGNLAGQVGVVA